MKIDTYGEFGGSWVPEVLVQPLEELTTALDSALDDRHFVAEFRHILHRAVGRETPLYFAPRLSAHHGARIWLKREDLCHTGAHKVNNTIGQALLARRMGKRRLIAETGAGQHGVATATAAAMLGMDCTVFMGATDAARQEANLFRMQLLGAEIVQVRTGQQTLKDATSEALRHWISCFEDTHYVIGSALGPSPYPRMVRAFQSVIGTEARAQFEQDALRLPDAVLACVGGGSNAIGMFSGFIDAPGVQLFGIEAGGNGVPTGRHAAPICEGTTGILHGFRSYFMSDDDGNMRDTHSISAGLDYPGVGPEHAWLSQTGRARYIACDDNLALDACRRLCRLEGILPALESSHALGVIEDVKAALDVENPHLLICLSGRGDKDMGILREEVQP